MVFGIYKFITVFVLNQSSCCFNIAVDVSVQQWITSILNKNDNKVKD